MSPHRAHHGHGAHAAHAAAASPAMRTELLELARHLREERLFVQHERASLQDLNERLRTASERLAHTAYVARQQRDNLDGLIFAQRGVDTSPAACCHRANTLEKTQFVDAYKQLSHQEVSLSRDEKAFFSIAKAILCAGSLFRVSSRLARKAQVSSHLSHGWRQVELATDA